MLASKQRLPSIPSTPEVTRSEYHISSVTALSWRVTMRPMRFQSDWSHLIRADMEHKERDALTILRRKQVEAESGYSRSTIYLRITQGLWTKPISLGARAVGWPAEEVTTLNAARVSGLTEDEIRCVVTKLIANRVKVFTHLGGRGIIEQSIDVVEISSSQGTSKDGAQL